MRAALPARGGLTVPAVAALAAFVVLLSLGSWQVQRKTWKEGLIADLTERAAAAPVSLPDPAQWQTLDPKDDEFRRVTFQAKFLPGEEALVYTSGSTLRPDVHGPGYWIMAPAKLPGGATIVINRGFVPDSGHSAPAPFAMPPGDTVTVVGALRWPESPSLFVGESDAAHKLWFVRDPAAMAAARQWGAVAPFYVELETPIPPGGVPKPGPLRPTLPNNHLQYALTWYGLAFVLAASFGFWAWGKTRGRRDSGA